MRIHVYLSVTLSACLKFGITGQNWMKYGMWRPTMKAADSKWPILHNWAPNAIPCILLNIRYKYIIDARKIYIFQSMLDIFCTIRQFKKYIKFYLRAVAADVRREVSHIPKMEAAGYPERSVFATGRYRNPGNRSPKFHRCEHCKLQALLNLFFQDGSIVLCIQNLGTWRR